MGPGIVKLPLVGQSYVARSTAASAATSINLIAERVQDENIPPQGNALSAGNPLVGKNKAFFVGCPGRRLFSDLTLIDAAATPIRGLFSNEGGLYAAAGPRYMNLDLNGNLIGSVRTIADDASHSPVTLLANGNQLLIVASGSVYCDNGAGPVLQSFPGANYSDLAIGYGGSVTTNGVGVSWQGGGFFNGGMEGQPITINGVSYTVATVINPLTLTLTSSAGVQLSVLYTQGVNYSLNSLTQPFTQADVGAVILVTPGGGFLGLSWQIVSVDQWGNAFSAGFSWGTVGSTGGIGSEAFPTLAGLNGAYLDGYFVVPQPNTTTYHISAINNGLSWDAADVGVKESYPDHIRAVMAQNEQLYTWGTETFEVWQNTGGGLVNNVAQFPFQRMDGASQKFGIVSTWSPIAIGGQIFFLGANREGQIVAYVLNGFTPQRISTHAEESQWNALGAPVNVISYGYTEEGHTFWVFSISGQTWHYDLATGAWGQRYAWNGSTYTQYPTNYHTFVAQFGTGKHITGGMLNGKLYESSVNIYSDDGNDIAWQRALPPLYNNGNQIYLGRVELEMETGTVASGPAPTITLDWSHDRGHTFINAEAASIGIAGDNTKRVFWINNGSGRYPIPRFSGVGQSKVALVDAEIELALGVD